MLAGLRRGNESAGSSQTGRNIRSRKVNRRGAAQVICKGKGEKGKAETRKQEKGARLLRPEWPRATKRGRRTLSLSIIDAGDDGHRGINAF